MSNKAISLLSRMNNVPITKQLTNAENSEQLLHLKKEQQWMNNYLKKEYKLLTRIGGNKK